MTRRVQVIDSHTGGEPTRLVVDGGPDLTDLLRLPAGSRSVDWPRVLKSLSGQHDHLRRGVLAEPRGADHWVGALLLPPTCATSLCSVVFFNNVGYLGMCGHGMIGLMASLAYLDRIQPGRFAIETPVGLVQAQLHDRHRVTIDNVASYCYRRSVPVSLAGRPPIVGDIAWGGNWFFLTDQHGLQVQMGNLPALTQRAIAVRQALASQGITGAAGQEIDHIEFLGSAGSGADSRSFVLCPGHAYDRSPCGTGTSAKIACLAAQGGLHPGQPWVQESITGSRFQATYRLVDAGERPEHAPPEAVVVAPRITGQAYVCGEGCLVFEDDDPFREGIGL